MNKKGELLIISVIFMALIILVIFAIVLVQYFQINNTLSDIKNSMFYICQNALLSYDNNLSLEEYNVSNLRLKKVIEQLINRNFLDKKSNIKSIDIKEIYVLTNENECIAHNNRFSVPFVHLVLEISFEPIINLQNKMYSFTIHEDVKVALMQY